MGNQYRKLGIIGAALLSLMVLLYGIGAAGATEDQYTEPTMPTVPEPCPKTGYGCEPTTPEPTHPSPEPTTPEPTYPEPTSPEPTYPTTPEPTTPEPTTPEPTTPEPTTPEPTTPEPTTPEPTTPEPTTPEPTTPEPTTPEPTEPSTPEPTEPEPPVIGPPLPPVIIVNPPDGPEVTINITTVTNERIVFDAHPKGQKVYRDLVCQRVDYNYDGKITGGEDRRAIEEATQAAGMLPETGGPAFALLALVAGVGFLLFGFYLRRAA